MYSRVGHDGHDGHGQGHEQSYSAEHQADQIQGLRHTPMPDPRPFQRQSRHGSLYSNHDYPEDEYHGDLSQTRYSQYTASHEDFAYNSHDRRQSNYDEPYQAAPQDIPLLLRPSRSTLYDPRDDQLQFLQHHPSMEAFSAAAHDPNSPLTAPQQSSNPYTSEQKIDGRLYKGNLVRDCPVPPKLLKTYSQQTRSVRDEFTHMRYTAATCDPAEFIEQNYELRQTLFTKTRATELLIVITMYNEDDLLFARTLAGVFENIEYMCRGTGKRGGSFGKDGWKKIVVCVVSDGRAKLNARTKAVLTALGLYQEEIGTEALNGQPVTGHIYEYTTQVGITVNKKTEVVETKPGQSIPVQMIFCLKEENKGKLNSHRWAFQAIGKALQGPNIVVLLDAGTRPGKTSVYELYRAFLLDKNCGGACGEIKAMLGRGMRLALKNPVVACQNFEYKMSNLLDKPMESAFGFISVLPGAFSAYRYVALQNNKDGIGPLEKYFGGEFKHGSANIFTRNMYLAEDRILCFELVAKQNASWVLSYVKSATGETDVPETVVGLIKQRRRWLNGSFFAAVYALTHFHQIFGTSHGFVRKTMFLVEFFFQFINMIFAWFAVGNFFLVFQILTTSLGAKDLIGRTGEVLSVIVEWIYLGTLVTCFVLALGNKPEGSPRFYRATAWIFGAIMLYLTFALILIPYNSVKTELEDGNFTFTTLFSNSVFFTLIISLLSTYVLWIFISVVSLDAWHLITSSFQYFLLSPTYVNTINIYAFCNVHDVSWGTREAEHKKNLGSTKIGTGADDNVDTEISGQDLDALYDAELQKFNTRAPEEAEPVLSEKAKNEFYDAGFRSYVVLAWMFCNAALVAVILKSGGIQRLSVQQELANGAASSVVKIYLTVVLWSVAGLSMFKFIGAMWYLIRRLFTG